MHEYEVGEILEKGVYVVVKKCTHVQSGKVSAAKVLQLDSFNDQQRTTIIRNFKRTESLLPLLHHPLLTSPSYLLINHQQACILYDLSEGPDLCMEIVSRAESGFVYSEAVASHYMKQILEALRHLHNQGIIHRDLRTSHITLATKDNSSPVKITGLSCAVSVNELEETSDYAMDEGVVGLGQTLVSCSKGKYGYLSSPATRAPEMQQAGSMYGKAVDVWSVGCFLYVLLYGTHPPPFEADSPNELLKGPLFEGVSEGGRELLRMMMEDVPSRRISVEAAINHPWIKDRSQVPKLHLADTVRNMQRFNHYRALKDSIVMMSLDPYWSVPANQMPLNPAIQSEIDFDLSGAEAVLGSVEGGEWLEGCTHISMTSFNKLTEHFQLNSFLNLFESINGRMPYFLANQHHDSLFLQFNELLDESEGRSVEGDEGVNELKELFLSQPHLLFLIKAHDLTAQRLNNNAAMRLVNELNQSENSIQVGNGAPNNGGIMAGNMGGNPHSETPESNPNNTVPNASNYNPSLFNSPYNTGLDNNNNTLVASNSGSSQSNSMDRVARIRLVQFQKNSDEPLGITLKRGKMGRVAVSRVLDRGMIHRQGILRVGDEIEEVNGKRLENESINSIQSILRECRGHVAFKIIQASRNQHVQAERYMKALFTYDPSQDPFIPSVEAGLPFSVGDILKVVDVDDEAWWQGRRLDSPEHLPARLIPSLELQETRIHLQDQAKKKNNCGLWTKSKRTHKEKYLLKHNSLFDQLELNTYEEVVLLPTFQYKTLVLLGAHGVGRRHIKNLFISSNPHKYAYPIPHTTRAPRNDEEHGRNYFFVTRDQMTSEIADNLFLEYGTHEGHLYGTKLETIQRIHDVGLIAILDIEPQALKILRTAEYAPYVVFIAVPNDKKFLEDQSLKRLMTESQLLEQTYEHVFNLSIVNNDIDETIQLLEHAVQQTTLNPQWVPVRWVY